MDTATSLIGRLPLGQAWSLDGLRGLLSKLKHYLPPEQLDVVRRAYEFGARAHLGQTRQSGERYISHPIAVASILAELHLDYESIVAAILHDVIEDTGISKAELAAQFGNEIAELVDGVSKLDRIRFKSKAEAKAESLRKMMLAMAQDIRVILLKLADRLHNMRTLGAMVPEKRRRIARETMDIYAPIANRLGLAQIRHELEDLCLKALYPTRYDVIRKSIKATHGEQRQSLRKIMSKLRKALASAKIEGEVFGREKHTASIYQKMRTKHRSLSEIVDVFGFRIVVNRVDECYRALGIVHQIYKPMPGRFKDYIAIPRVNGYQSLHTTLVGPGGVPIEVQLRTTDMDKVAETGIAAHWLYKLGDSSTVTPHTRAREWLNSLVELQADTTSEEFLESVRLDLYPDKVYVFTPRGDIMRLPRGATVIDFAYAVHTDVGNRCVEGTVDRRRVPLRTALRNGQTVKINTRSGAQPNPVWLNFVVTAKARSAIKAYMKNMRTSEAVRLGRRLLDVALRDLGMTIDQTDQARLADVSESLGHASADALFQDIGLGRQLAPIIARRLVIDSDDIAISGSESAPILIAGTEGMVVSFSQCCSPIPGDPVMGYLSAGRGVVVHRNECGNLAEFRKQPEKWVSVAWEPGIDREFPVELRVDSINRVGVLATLAGTISDCRSNIDEASVHEEEDASLINFTVKVRDTEHLHDVMRKLDAHSDVMRVTRVCD
ncbi:MAG: bifunctional (p)ppGpp synthetase/guanosine-3',5'-bis(diphosphate) 3'-pyrophosphohydrolase [Pseudomonadota bacterium]